MMRYVRQYPTPDALSAAVAAFVCDLAVEAVRQYGRFSISLSGGTTPEKLFALLALPPYSEKMPWKQTHVFWGDERCVSYDDPRNNARMAQIVLLDKVGIPPGNIHRIRVELAPEDAAVQYERELSAVLENESPHFDLVLLGIGNDGHTASLFPGTEVLNEQNRLVKACYVESQQMYRVTMTLPLINRAKAILILVSGTGKADILKKLLNEEGADVIYPAQMVKPENGDVYWFIDEAAAASLPDEPKHPV